jgi:hypothetical protein
MDHRAQNFVGIRCDQGRIQGVAAWMQPSQTPPPPKPKSKKYRLCKLISKVLRDFPFCQIQPLKLADA